MTPCLSSVHSPETTDDSSGVHISHPRYGPVDHDDLSPVTPLEASFRHSCWAATRKRVYDALVRTHQKERRIDRFANCGSALWLNRDGDELVLTSNGCHDRFCVPCQTARRHALVERILVRISEARHQVRHVTLTLKCQPIGLAAQFDRLVASFRRLRANRFWRENVTGGAAFIELKLGKNSHDWHVHFHCLVETRWLDQAQLCKEWHRVTGDSYITHVEPIGDPKRRALYVTKYATKPLDSTVTSSPQHLDEAVETLKGRRLFTCFGSWDGLAADDDQDTSNLRPVGSLNSLHRDAHDGDATALRWLEAAYRKWPSLREFFPPPRPGDERPPPE